jgi:hypothetical protein
MKRHAALRAAVSTPDQMEIGGDNGRVTYRPEDHLSVLDAIESLLSGFRRDDIRTGNYSAATIAMYGPLRWLDQDAVVARVRPSYLLDFLCAVATRPESNSSYAKEDLTMIDVDDHRAAEIIALIADCSQRRRSDGIVFWRSELRHRLARYAHLGLRDLVARLLCDLRCDMIGAGRVAAWLDALPASEISHIERCLHKRGSLVIAIAKTLLDARRTVEISTPSSEDI